MKHTFDEVHDEVHTFDEVHGEVQTFDEVHDDAAPNHFSYLRVDTLVKKGSLIWVAPYHIT